jgi:hypothetical protein
MGLPLCLEQVQHLFVRGCSARSQCLIRQRSLRLSVKCWTQALNIGCDGWKRTGYVFGKREGQTRRVWVSLETDASPAVTAASEGF